MTNKEMAEIFSIMLLAWPNSETFKGGIAKLEPTIRLWTSCTADVDFWTGQQAVYRLCRQCKFPPTIAEFQEQANAVNAEIRVLANRTLSEIRCADALDSIAGFYKSLPRGSFTREVIDTLGGPDALSITSAHDGKITSIWNLPGIEAACQSIVCRCPAIIGGRLPAGTDTKERR